MIHTAKQLKDKVRNISKGDNNIAKMMIRNFVMERFLERVSLSAYKNNFILKGGMLVASIVGVDMRATMDIDTTVKSLTLNEEEAKKVILEICSVHIEDVITPKAVEYEYKLMFEDRSIQLLSYNVETLLAEKTQTIITRGIANTRLRDFYDVYEIVKMKEESINKVVLKEAFSATCKKRDTVFTQKEMNQTLKAIENDFGLEEMWNKFKENNYFVGELQWSEVSKFDIEVINKYLVYK